MRFAVVVAAAVAMAMLQVWTVFAHAEPATAKPGDGAILAQAPGEVVLVMSQELARQAGQNDIDVFDSVGREVTAAAAVVDNNDRTRLSVGLPSGLAPGKYTVKWKTLSSEDGDPASGELSFTYDPNGTPSPGREQLREDLLSPVTPGAGTGSPALNVENDPDGVTWVLVVAVGIGMFVLGAGGAFLLVQKRA